MVSSRLPPITVPIPHDSLLGSMRSITAKIGNVYTSFGGSIPHLGGIDHRTTCIHDDFSCTGCRGQRATGLTFSLKIFQDQLRSRIWASSGDSAFSRMGRKKILQPNFPASSPRVSDRHCAALNDVGPLIPCPHVIVITPVGVKLPTYTMGI